MKLSEALQAAPRFAVQIHHGGFYKLDGERVGADTLFGAYLGRYGKRGLLRITELADEKGFTAACMEIQRGLLRNWPDLGRTVNSVERKKLSGGNIQPPMRGETWVGYISRLNDTHRYTWDQIAGITEMVGL